MSNKVEACGKIKKLITERYGSVHAFARDNPDLSRTAIYDVLNGKADTKQVSKLMGRLFNCAYANYNTPQQHLDNVSLLVNACWKPYNEIIPDKIYSELECKHELAAEWYVNEDVYLCLGCPTHCLLHRPEGFDCNPNQSGKFGATPAELLSKHELLTIKQAAYCLNVSYGLVFRWVVEGKIPATKFKPRRIPSSVIRQKMTENTVSE